jgi:glycosyltransferase involved in cell wall biosynthesis
VSAAEVSCVIPAYESLDLLARCLTSVATQHDVVFEIIVTDDSSSPSIRDFVLAMRDRAPTIHYRVGPKTGNPVDNWNAGLDEARAPFHLLIHQDEFLVDRLYLRKAVDALDRTGAAAALAGVSVIGVNRPSRFGLVAPIAGRLWGAMRLLPVINWIGPTAAFMFRAGHRFDPDLVQLVDVEFYLRVLRTGPLVRLPGVGVGSLGHHGAQISARIDAAALAVKELALLAGRAPPTISPLAHRLYAAALTSRSWFG